MQAPLGPYVVHIWSCDVETFERTMRSNSTEWDDWGPHRLAPPLVVRGREKDGETKREREIHIKKERENSREGDSENEKERAQQRYIQRDQDRERTIKRNGVSL